MEDDGGFNLVVKRRKRGWVQYAFQKWETEHGE